MYVCLGGKFADAMAAEDVYGRSRDEVILGNKRNVFCAHAFVSDLAIERMVGLVLVGDCNLDLEVKVERKTDDVETGANVG